MRRINPNSSIRRGYRFEDLYVLYLCVDWLKNPEAYQQLQIQHVPDEIDGKRFAIDDIVLIDNKGYHIFYQLKYKQHPQKDLWDFNELIKKGLSKWIQSYKDASSIKVKESFFITNGFPASDIKQCLEGNKINLSKLSRLFPQAFAQLSNQYNNRLLSAFFNNFSFVFCYTEVNTLDNKIRQTLYNDLKATKDGVNNLLLHIANEGSEQYPTTLTVAEIRSLLAWDNPRPLNQNFDIPSDFEFFDKNQHEDLLRRITDPKGGIQVLIGKPGSGKSTYLSKLYELLNNTLKIPVARHHYHLNPKDTSFRERLNADRVKEALRAEFKKQKNEILGELSYQNTEHIQLRDFIERISKYYTQKGECFVLIVDGLDHVIREGKNEDELREFLDEILYPQPGFFILFGTQEVATSYFPNVVHQYCPKQKWIEIKGLKKPAVEKIVHKNRLELGMPNNKELYNDISNKIFEKTKGNPLHLRYVLNQLKNLHGISADDVEAILPYKHEIEEYYQDLWRQLPYVSKSICFSIAFLDFKLHEEEIIDLAGYFTRYPSEIHSSYDAIKHLIKKELSGVSVYHDSFLVFLLKQEELERHKKGIYKQIRRWLKKTGNEQLKWSELARIEYYLGNDKPILSLNKQWVIDSFLDCKSEEQIEKLLNLAVEAAFAKRDYEKVIFFKTLEVYFSNRRLNLWDTLDKIWVTSFSYNKNILTHFPEFHKFNHSQLKEILLSLKEAGKIHFIPDEVFERFNELFKDNNYQMHDVIDSWLQIIASFESETVHSAYKFIKQGRIDKFSPNYFRSYTRYLLLDDNQSKLNKLLKCNFLPNEKLAIAEELVLHDLRNKRFSWKFQIKKLVPLPSEIIQFYLILSGDTYRTTQKLPDYVTFPDKVERHSISSEHLALYNDNFYLGLFSAFSKNGADVVKWINQGGESWPVQLMAKSLEIGLYLYECFSKKKRCSIKKILKYYDDLPELDYYDDYEIYELRRSVLPVLLKLSLELQTFINLNNNHSPFLSATECLALLKCKWLYNHDLVSLFTSRKIYLSDKAFDEYEKHEISKISSEIIPFKDQAERLSNLAILAKQLKKDKAAIDLNRRAAEHIIAYGHHKDMLLYSIMESIKICADNGSKKGSKYLRKIAKYVYNIEDLTDGDETGSFLYNYGGYLASIDPNLLYNLYFDAITKRSYGVAESLFGDVLSTLNLKQPIAKAIASTAVEHHAYNSLCFLSKTNVEAKKILKEIQSVFGPIDYSYDRGSSHSGSINEKEKDEQLFKGIAPDKLKDHLLSINGSNYYHRKHEQSDYLLGWSKHWLRKTSMFKTVIEQLRIIVEAQPQHFKYELLDFIYPYALKANKQFAFMCKVWAHANNSSWSGDYIQRMEESQKRWLRVIEDFPTRTVEFFEKSIQFSGSYYGSSTPSYYIPIPKGTQFFVDCGQLKKAEKITEYHIKSLELLFPGAPITEPNFLVNERQIDEFEILMERFQSMSPLVRERAGWYLADLLEKDASGNVHKVFLRSLSNLSLETIVCNGLLVLIKSLQNKNSYSYEHLNVSKFANTLKVFCRAIQLLLTKISLLLGQHLHIEIPFIISATHHRPPISEEKFLKKLGTYLPLAYQGYINQLQKKTQIKIWEIWCNMYYEACEELKLNDSQSDQDYANDRREFMTGRNTVFSELLRSIFFKLLDYLKEIWVINDDDLFYYILKNLPIDPSIWKISLSQKPVWWPQFIEASREQKEFKFISLKTLTKNLVFSNARYQLLHLSGAIAPAKRHYEDSVEGTIHIVPFLYRKTGDSLPDTNDIYSVLEQTSVILYPWVTDRTKFGLFENPLAFNKAEEVSFFENLEIMPLVNSVLFLAPHMCQHYRWRYSFKLLGPLLAQLLVLHTGDGHIRYFKKKKKVVQIFDFANGLRDRAQYNAVTPVGNYALIEKGFLDEFLKTQQMQLGYVVRQEHFIRDYSHSKERKENVIYELIGVT